MNADHFSIKADRLLPSCAPISRPPLQMLNKYIFNRPLLLRLLMHLLLPLLQPLLPLLQLLPLLPQPTTVADVKQIFL